MNTLKVGDKVPSFKAIDHLGKAHAIEDYLGSKLVVFFYPKANTPGCTLEACNLRDHYSELKAAGYSLLGVSADTEKKQKNFADKFEFPFPLLADTEKDVIEAFGVWGPNLWEKITMEFIEKHLLSTKKGSCYVSSIK